MVGLQPLQIANDVSVHTAHPPGYCPAQNIAEISAAAHGLLVRLDWPRVGLGVVEEGWFCSRTYIYISTSVEHCIS